MDGIFPMSGLNSPSTESNDPFEVSSVRSDPFDLDDRDREERAATSETKRLHTLVADFARGFDAGTFPAYVHAWIARLQGILFPGSYAHLLVILLKDWDQMEYFQLALFQWLCERYPVPGAYRVGGTQGVDGRLFVSELGILKKLLAPLSGDFSRPIYWIGARVTHPDDSCNQVVTSMRIIERFKKDILAEIQGPNDERTIYSLWDSTDDRKAEISVREFRMDASRASLGWGDFLKNDIHFTSFHQQYKAHLIQTAPERARAIGFLPPRLSGIPPAYIPVRPDEDNETSTAWCDWQHADLKGSVLDLILKMAVWLGLARGAAAVHLFCDVVRAFSLKKPTRATHPDRIALLYHFTALRISSEGIESGLATPFAYEDQSFMDENTEHVTDETNPAYSNNDNDNAHDPGNENDLGTTAASNYTSATLSNATTTTLNAHRIPLIRRRARVTHGQIKLYYHVREVIEALSQASVETTLSSKMAASVSMHNYARALATASDREDEKMAGTVAAAAALNAKLASRPVAIPSEHRRRRAGSSCVVYR